MEMKNCFAFVGVLLVVLVMFSLVSGAGYNITVPAVAVATTTTTGSGGGSGGGGGSSGAATYSVTAAQLITGYNRELGLNDRFKVNISNELHYVKLVAVTATTVSINVSSETQQATLVVGDARKFDVDGDDNYDLSVVLDSINVTSSKAYLTVKSVSGAVTEESVAEEQAKEEVAVEVAAGEAGKSFVWVWVVVVLIVIGGIVYWVNRG